LGSSWQIYGEKFGFGPSCLAQWSQGQILAQLLARAEYTFGAVLYIKMCVLNIIITTDLILKNLKKIKYVYSPMSFNISF
jgi:hypothetical protein